ncbi:recombinase family protein [Geobacter sp.]|uniref:recombinase family protein n=1 Tax=Geobacter sp. TaxID=46610 RepID=UPI0027B904C1|nr:recombinase family protein [Geobacter sp.]
MKHYIAYLRVSTDKQGEQGHGISAQRQAIRSYLGAQGGELLEEYVEVESGKKNDRPALQKAINRCKMSRATLIIAKLDRLSRNLAFIANLMDAGIDFIACDNPYANKLTIHILAAIAEHEREMISRRTREALAAAKAKGVKLGGHRGAILTEEIQLQGLEERRTRAREYAANVYPTIRELLDAGHSLNGTAQALNSRRILTARGCMWTAKSVSRILQAAEDR